MRRSGTVPAEPEAVWALVADPRELPRWWPGIDRVEEATDTAWTQVATSSRGKAVRADYTRTEADRPRAIEWRQEIDESPFERFLSEAVTRVSLEPAGPDRTRVEIRARRRLRGLALLGSPLVRLATRRQLGEALGGLATLVERARSGSSAVTRPEP